MRRIDAFATLPHYLTHVAAVWTALPASRRGHLFVPPQLAESARQAGCVPTVARRPPVDGKPILVAGWQDYRETYGRPVALLEHGAGQHYVGTCHRAHPGGPQRGRVGLYLCPNQDVAARNLATYPAATAAVVGAPHLDRWHRAGHRAPDGPVVISWHFDSMVAPEARSAWPHYGPTALEQLRALLGGRLHGHAHPRVLDRFRATYRTLDIPLIETFDQVLDTAALYLVDNSSTGYEAASAGIPVICLNAPWYRRDVEHGLRFWTNPPGPQIDGPHELTQAVTAALEDPAALVRSARPAVAVAYISCDGRSAHRASCAVGEWLDQPPSGVRR